MSRLVVISNRVGPFKDTGKAGGLAVALVDVLKANGGLWFGWSGEISDQGTFGTLNKETFGKVELATIDMTQDDYDEFYIGYANQALWPTLHYRLDLADFDRRFEAGYRRMNERLASRVHPMLQDNDTIWVHDYHFFHVGSNLRQMGVKNPIGFFLHIPFPVPEILSALPNSHGFVRQMLAYDLIGFQTQRDADALIRYLKEEAGGRVLSDGRIEANGRAVDIRAFPIGIDTAGFAKAATGAEARRNEQKVRRLLGDREQIIGVDRIDYSKGLPQRLKAFAKLLEDYPENRNKVSLMQVAPPSRSELDAYQDIRHELESLAGHVNGRFAELDWTPIRFMTRGMSRRTLAGVYRASRVGFVTPLRDGMNLVAKEYIAAQNKDDPGVLVLSRFAGASEELQEALQVNPYSDVEMAEALQSALRMPLDERQERWARLFERISKHDAANWAQSFISNLERAAQRR